MPEKELVAEVIREKALLFMRDEIPHGIAVVVAVSYTHLILKKIYRISYATSHFEKGERA